MKAHRRQVLVCLTSAMAVSASPWNRAAAQPARTPFAALLAPLTGPNAEVGRSMERAVRLVQPAEGFAGLTVIDTNLAGAGAAASQAVAAGARTLLGPVNAIDLGAVVSATAGRARILAFTNDDDAAASGASILGLTASQTVAAVLAYARSRGVRRVGVVAGADRAGAQVIAAARKQAAALGLEVLTPTANGGRAEADWGASGPPDAVLYADVSAAAQSSARALKTAGVQLLGLPTLASAAPDTLAAFEGAWISAPDPSAIAEFGRRYEASGAQPPGLLAALAYDAAGIARTLAGGAALDRTAGFTGVVGAVRFDSEGRCSRELTILAVQDGRMRVVDRRRG